jgi:galactose mutarotase-like enzyme
VSQCAYPSAPWQGAAIQDHGELWSQDAEVEIIEDADKLKLLTRWQGVALPYTFTRLLTLAADSSLIHATYEVTNKADQPIHYVWSIHPLIAIEAGMELRLPASARFNVAGSIPPGLVSAQQAVTYPFAAPGLNFPALPDPSTARAIKIWSDPLPADSGWAALIAADGQLQMRWDTSLLPQVAAWMNFGAWSADGGSPYFNLGLEPCIGAQDSLADAVNQYNLFEVLPPHESKSWWLEIELTV